MACLVPGLLAKRLECQKVCSTYIMQARKLTWAELVMQRSISMLLHSSRAGQHHFAFRIQLKVFISFVVGVCDAFSFTTNEADTWILMLLLWPYNTRNLAIYIYTHRQSSLFFSIWNISVPLGWRRKVCNAETSPKYAVRKFYASIQIFSLAFASQQTLPSSWGFALQQIVAFFLAAWAA